MQFWGKIIIPHLLSVVVTTLTVLMQDQNSWGMILGLAFFPFTADHLQKAITFANSEVWHFKWEW